MRATIPMGCTVTGVDATTDLQRVAALSIRFPFSEWAFLWSPSRCGREHRYPSMEYLSRALSALSSGVRVALHLCGEAVDDFVGHHGDTGPLVRAVATRGGRIQLNVGLNRKSDFYLENLDLAIGAFPGEVILQHNALNETALDWIIAPNLAYLFDVSGGRGVTPDVWPARVPGISCGYAGGLGPSSLDRELPRIAAAGGPPAWVDMETGVRDADDNFDLDLVARAMEIVDQFRRPDNAGADPHAERANEPGSVANV